MDNPGAADVGMGESEPVLAIAVPAPVMQLYDYLPPPGESPHGQQGRRVLVPFGRSRRVGLVMGVREPRVPRARLRPALDFLDQSALLPEDLLRMLEWAAAYYQHPPGEVVAAALPASLRRGGALADGGAAWHATAAGRIADLAALAKRAPVQSALLGLLVASADGLDAGGLDPAIGGWRRAMPLLAAKGLVEQRTRPLALAAATARTEGPCLTAPQQAAVERVLSGSGFRAFLLDGVTGSGKTEVYLRCINAAIESGRQSLVLVPEIALTPQLVARFRERLDAPVVELHSGLSDSDRLRAWTAARAAAASVVIGTRSAVFAPLAHPGLIIVDEEHDASYKQQEGFRYSGRDLAVWRARALDVPVVLGSATPSLESIENARAGRYERLVLPARTGEAGDPAVQLVDMRRHPPTDGLTQPLAAAIQAHLDAGGQVLVYLNRRGFAPVLLCPACGQVAECLRCDARMVVHQRRAQLICHHCGAERPLPEACPECRGELQPVGHGTERLEQALRARFGDTIVARVDRDAVRRRGELTRQLDRVRRGDARVLVGTQMVTKGHDFPRVTLVGVVDTDQGLFGTDFRSSERLAQSLIQVAGRAGRAAHPGQVLIQTLFPEHPLLRVLLASGYGGFAELALAERRQAGWPPFSYLALLRAEASGRPAAFAFLDEARACAPESGGRVQLLGPAPAPMERRSGRYRGQLLVRAESRASLQRFLAAWRPALEAARGSRRARWSLDVDPVELF